MEFNEHAKHIQLKQRQFFATQRTKDVRFRKQELLKLKKAISEREDAIYEALQKDFKKCKHEAFLSELGLVEIELNIAIKNINSWSRTKRVFPSLLNFPSSDYLIKEPYGQVLILSPWNYPFMLAIVPLISAIAAGNTVVLKPSELTPNTSALLKELISNTFEEGFIALIEGGIPEATTLLNMRWDYIYFTGSVPVGKIVAQAAAKNLTPVTLELGGKTPCIVDKGINIKLAARRIVWGKFLNGGQTCVAPDYLLVHSSIKAAFIESLKEEITKAYGKDIKVSPDFPRIINTKNFERLTRMLQNVDIAFGGETDKDECFISPTLIDNPSLNDTVMKEEIFGPILPILAYETVNDIKNILVSLERPLSMYVFSKNRKWAQKITKHYSFGGGVINDVLIHYGNSNLPFGGVGHSGIGNNHGKYGFDTFTHEKPIIKKAIWLDLPFRYAPYKGKFGLLKAMFRWFG